MKIKLDNKLVLLTILFISVVLFIFHFSYNDINSLYVRAALQDRPSKQHYDLIERIYKKINKDNIYELVSAIDNKESVNLDEMYIHTLGIYGYNNPKGYYIKLLSMYEDVNNNISTINNIYLSMGLSGGSEYTEILNKSLAAQDDISIAYRRYIIALSLYLLTGNNYEYINPQGKRELFGTQDYIVVARDVINNSKNRVRTLEEMIALDKLTRPYGW